MKSDQSKTKSELIKELQMVREGRDGPEISKRKQAEDSLRESEDRFKNIVSSSPLGIFIYELEDDGRLVFMDCNPAASSILGLDCSQFIEMSIEEAFPPLAETEIPDR